MKGLKKYLSLLKATWKEWTAINTFQKSKIAEIIEQIDNAYNIICEHSLLAGLLATFCFLFPLMIIASVNIFAGLKFFFFIIILVCTYLLVRKLVFSREAQRMSKIEFYKECRDNYIDDLSWDSDRQKAELIAQRLGCKYQDIEQYFEEAKVMTLGYEDAKEKEDKENWIRELRGKELRVLQEITRFSHYQGREKRIAMLEYKQNKYREEAKRKKDAIYSVAAFTQQREMNSGIAGGIASGLFGGLAGVAAAVDVEKKNAQIRAQNKANLDAMMPAFNVSFCSALECERSADRLQKDIDDAKIKVVANTPENNIINYMTFEDADISISETGAFTIRVRACLKEKHRNLKIRNANAVIDGTIAAEMYQKGEKVGRALMVLPMYGLQDRMTLEGISIGEADCELPYEIKYKPHHLWIMER